MAASLGDDALKCRVEIAALLFVIRLARLFEQLVRLAVAVKLVRFTPG